MTRQKSVSPEFYDEEYFLKGTKSGYGGQFWPYTEEYFLPEERKFAKNLIELTKAKSVLVLGCARGYLVKALRELDVDAYGVDISAWAIENSPSDVKPFLVLADACYLSFFKDQQFDVCVAYDVLEHIAMSDLIKAISETCRLTKNYILLHVPVVDNGVDESHVSIFLNMWWRQQFNTRGWKTIYNRTIRQNDGIISSYIFFQRRQRNK